MRKVFLEDLPRYSEGRYRGKINWKESIGLKISFVYDEIKGEIEIVDYNPKGQNIYVKYLNNRVYKIKTSDLIKCGIGGVIGTYTNDFKIEIGEIFKDKKRDLTIINREYRIGSNNKKLKWYKYKCNNCKYENWTNEINLLSGNGCPCCSNNVVVSGVNDIYTTDKWMLDLGVSEEDSKKYTKSSNLKVDVVCPNCGRKKYITISSVYTKKTIGCTCGDGFSYPTKFILSFLKQLNVDFETEYNPKYLKPRRSDFYLPKHNLVIEADGGMGHKGGKVHGKSKKTLEELIKIDNWKEEQHLKHGIRTIRIDCFKSDIDYIKNNILNGELNNIFDLDNIDWLECEKFALSNRVKEVCDIKRNNPHMSTLEISKLLGLSRVTVTTYLKKGDKLGMCYYNSKEKFIKDSSANTKKVCKERVEVLKNGESFGVYESASFVSKNSEKLFGVKLSKSVISSYKNKIGYKTKSGFDFRFYKEEV